ncbi:MAG: ribbon-helix-helix protein, CopG family [Actinobacteria bacterium]|nr:ribbon-helix-helix protein, CopG family [Actinomycetota bacterium]
MLRRTITIPEALAAAIDELVRLGAVPSVSRFFQDAARVHLDGLKAERAAAEALLLDAAEEEALALGDAGEELRSPWGRLR